MVYHKQECQRLQDEISLLEKELSLMPNYDEVYPVVPIYRLKKENKFLMKAKNILFCVKKYLN